MRSQASFIAIATICGALVLEPAASLDQSSSPVAAPIADTPNAHGRSGISRDVGSPGEPTVRAVLLPARMAADEKLGKGCWVRFYDHKDFSGASLTVVGPMDMPMMNVPGGLWRDWDSAIVGPRAAVSTFDSAYPDKTAHLRPGQRIADLSDKKLGWFDDIRSARVLCST
jgi:hypothetical protein